MKNAQQNLLIVLALGLCLLCAYQWYGQTRQRGQIDRINQLNYEKSVAIQNYTNSISTMQHEMAEKDKGINELKALNQSFETTMREQKVQLNKLEAMTEVISNQNAQYKQAVDDLEAKMKQAYDGVQKQNEAIKQLAAQRDEFVQKLNDTMTDRNEVVKKYNDLVERFEKLQSGGAKTQEK